MTGLWTLLGVKISFYPFQESDNLRTHNGLAGLLGVRGVLLQLQSEPGWSPGELHNGLPSNCKVLEATVRRLDFDWLYGLGNVKCKLHCYKPLKNNLLNEFSQFRYIGDTCLLTSKDSSERVRVFWRMPINVGMVVPKCQKYYESLGLLFKAAL